VSGNACGQKKSDWKDEKKGKRIQFTFRLDEGLQKLPMNIKQVEARPPPGTKGKSTPFMKRRESEKRQGACLKRDTEGEEKNKVRTG